MFFRRRKPSSKNKKRNKRLIKLYLLERDLLLRAYSFLYEIRPLEDNKDRDLILILGDECIVKDDFKDNVTKARKIELMDKIEKGKKQISIIKKELETPLF